MPETLLGRVRLNTPLELQVDGFPGRIFPGRVAFVAQQAEFTPGNVQTPEERGQQVFRIKVEITDESGELRPGMAADLHFQP